MLASISAAATQQLHMQRPPLSAVHSVEFLLDGEDLDTGSLDKTFKQQYTDLIMRASVSGGSRGDT